MVIPRCYPSTDYKLSVSPVCGLDLLKCKKRRIYEQLGDGIAL